MKVGFFGTPDIAAYVLEFLCKKYEIVFLVASEDKPCGRDLKLSECPSKEIAKCKNIPVLQPSKLRSEEFINTLKAFGADIFVVVAYGRLIPPEVFTMPPLGTINLHPSLLPLYRGAAPVQWALLNGDKETGITVQMINEELDAGDIVLQEKLKVDENITRGELDEIIFPLGAELVAKAIDLLGSGKANLIKQDHSKATYCSKIDKETAHIKWSRTAQEIHNQVRALNPKPVAWTTFRGQHLKIWRSLIFREEKLSLNQGEILRYQKKRLLLGTGDGILEILELQPENKKKMDALAFINGYRLQEGESFL
ncbi:MAG TPA: methionyl-tRNA formyltransferase [Spirochaetota bacterium]|jgi:methionyl-tRNA formyltransferase|nr:methionyl-tRNA formyltransferase [Spirochaetota bacterium]OQA99905.1 MAG: Methionyl-tRNA formyltransferase [Spirochaetes bacterium ADurb.Bin218]HOK02163.1 methionyl-tRNA formyltransferase [Spirochaetota bacterium]HOK92648.1 methionyl-tRNA formyltransferase [Spirochaetota bacterium]HON15339.1 methionyl-tRNA formyltransferase [Spirochaetota bacterium]